MCLSKVSSTGNLVHIRTEDRGNMAWFINVEYIVTDDNTGEVLAKAGLGETMTFELNKTSTLRCHLRGYKDALIKYVPNGTKYYRITKTESGDGIQFE